MARFFDVVLNVPMNQTFTYLEKTDYTLQKDESASEPDLFAKKKRAVKQLQNLEKENVTKRTRPKQKLI